MSAIYDINMCARTSRASKERLDQLSHARSTGSLKRDDREVRLVLARSISSDRPLGACVQKMCFKYTIGPRGHGPCKSKRGPEPWTFREGGVALALCRDQLTIQGSQGSYSSSSSMAYSRKRRADIGSRPVGINTMGSSAITSSGAWLSFAWSDLNF